MEIRTVIAMYILCPYTPGFHMLIPYTSKHWRGKTFAVHQQYALCMENFRGLQT